MATKKGQTSNKISSNKLPVCALNKLLKHKIAIFLLNFTRTHCDYMLITYGQNFLVTVMSRHIEKQLGKQSKKALVCSHFRAKQTNKSTTCISLCPKEYR